MRTHLRATAHLYLIAVIVAMCAALVLGGCKATSNTLARWGGAATGALAGGAVGGPAGAAVGAVAGDAGGDALVEDPPQTVNETTIENHGGTVNVASAQRSSGWPWWYWLVGSLAALLAIPRTRPHVLGFLYSLVHGHPLAALAKAGASVGWVHSERADAMLTEARRRRRGTKPPAVVVSSEAKPHA